jgi:hypothetical protein
MVRNKKVNSAHGMREGSAVAVSDRDEWIKDTMVMMMLESRSGFEARLQRELNVKVPGSRTWKAPTRQAVRTPATCVERPWLLQKRLSVPTPARSDATTPY